MITRPFATVDLLDEDNMTSNSDEKGATQQSIKAYVDANTGGLFSTITVQATGKTLVAGELLILTGATQTGTLPASPSSGDICMVKMRGAGMGTIGRNLKKINGVASDLTLTNDGDGALLVYDGVDSWETVAFVSANA